MTDDIPDDNGNVALANLSECAVHIEAARTVSAPAWWAAASGSGAQCRRVVIPRDACAEMEWVFRWRKRGAGRGVAWLRKERIYAAH